MSTPSHSATSTSTARNLVMGKMRGSDATVIRDVTDIDHPKPVATLDFAGGLGLQLGFASSTEVSYIDDAHDLIRAPFSGSPAVTVLRSCGVDLYGWSPDGQSVTYLESSAIDGGSTLTNLWQWHLVVAGRDRVIGSAPAPAPYGNGTPEMSLVVGFSPDARKVYVVEHAVSANAMQIRTLDGALVGSGTNQPGDYWTMPAWAGGILYARTASGVQAWSDGGAHPFLPGSEWLRPSVSPSGKQIVFAIQGADGLSHLSVVDVPSGTVRPLSRDARSAGVFLTPRFVWSVGERLCAPSDGCAFSRAVATGMTYIDDLQSGTESESVLTDVIDTWPHAT